MNNHWHTNYRAEQEGPTLFRYFIWPHRPADPDKPARFGTDVAQPLIPLPAQRASSQRSRLSVDTPGVMVSAFKPSEDGRAIIVRLFAVSGKAERTRLRWSEPAPRKIWLSDASEAPVSPLDGPVNLPPYGLVSVRADL
jgi:alpha-mannosidase